MIKLKINHVPGFTGFVTVQADEKGIPLEKFWRRRLTDAKFDNCVEIVPTPTTKKPKE